MRKEIRLAGFGGQGIISLGILIAAAAGKFAGQQVAQTQSYGPEARGGACKTEVVISDVEIDYIKAMNPDILLVMSQPALDKHIADIDSKNTMVVIDSTLVKNVPEQLKRVFQIPATQMAEDEQKNRMSANLIMLGAMVKLSGLLTYEACQQSINANFPAQTFEKNIAAFDSGYKFASSMQEGGAH